MATLFSILVWEILRAEKTGGPQMGQKSEGVVVRTLSKPCCLQSSASVTCGIARVLSKPLHHFLFSRYLEPS